MLIDWNKLHEIHVGKIPLLAEDERFVSVPYLDDYACSTYGRLYRKTIKGGWNKVDVTFHRGSESYNVELDNGMKKIIPIRKMLAMVFYPEEQGIYLYNPYWNPFLESRWKVENFHVLRGKNEMVEVIRAKIEHRNPIYADASEPHGFINRMNFNQNINSKISSMYYNMKSRAKNEKVKEQHPQYKNTTICDEWDNDSELFYDWIIGQLYEYPGNISLDKDILSYGIENRYCPEYTCIVPVYINNIFTTDTSRLGYSIQEHERANGTKYYIVPASAYRFQDEKLDQIICATYIEALQKGRKRKARLIRKVVQYEREQGYVPEEVLISMEKWANRCELGLVKIWEPSDETLQKMGVI